MFNLVIVLQDADAETEKREELIQDLRDELDKVNMLLEASAKKGLTGDYI